MYVNSDQTCSWESGTSSCAIVSKPCSRVRSQAGGADLLGALGADGRGSGHAGPGGHLGQDVLAPEPARSLRIIRQRYVGELVDLSRVVEDDLDVLVALGEEDRPLGQAGQEVDQAARAVHHARALEVTRTQPELLGAEREAVHRHALAPEAAHDREPRVQEAEHDDRPHRSASS
jgi:hypothetical protein